MAQDSTRISLDYSTPQAPPLRYRSGRLEVGCMFAVLLFAAFACLFLAFMLTGAGHGWTSAVPVSEAGLIAAPVSGVAWAMRRRAVGKGIALLLVIGSIIANGILLALTKSEGTDYFDRVWSSIPEG